MKNVIMLIVAIAAFNIGSAQKLKVQNIPAKVVQSLEQNFKNAKNVSWEKEKENYEAEFKIATLEQSVLFDANGVILEKEVAIEINQLPKNVLNYIQTNYPTKKVKEAAKITDSKNKITYEAEIKGQELLFDASGKFLEIVKN